MINAPIYGRPPAWIFLGILWLASLSVRAQPFAPSQPLSQIVLELATVTFSVGVSGNPPPTYQWFRNSAVIPDATNATYQIRSPRLCWPMTVRCSRWWPRT